MKSVFRLLLLLLVCLAVPNSSSWAEDLPIGEQKAQKTEVQATANMSYWMYLPEGYTPEKKYPLVLFLHGRGERGDNLDEILKHGPPKLVSQGKKFPFILVSPQLPTTHLFWQTAELIGLLDYMEKTYSVDSSRIYVTGLSMGGFATWALGVAQPDRFAALIPICGQGDPSQASRLKDIPIWVFHGTDDKAVPFARSQEMVKALKAAGSPVEFTIYEGVGHDSWTETYNNPQVYEWLLEQKLPAK